MKNPFTLIANKYTQTFGSEQQKLKRLKKKDEGTKKETHRGKGGGGSNIASGGVVTDIPSGVYNTNRATRKRIKRRRMRRKMARRSRRINRLKAA